jgi:poly-gamma-glutamate capsule biosynthesis protein CapA/YwtB (metallophosphatase superfamily)
MRRAAITHGVVLLLALIARADGPGLLDIYFEESHAGTFYHLAETLPLDEPHTLVLVDAHSDASAVADSDRIREALRKVPAAAARQELLARWRKAGTVQCYDWIEPLMPAPFEKVVWVAAPKLNRIQIGRNQVLARENLDGLQEAFPRACGEIGERYRVTDWDAFTDEAAKWARDQRVVVSLDLDYFAAVPDARLAAEFERVFAGLLKVPGLRVLTFSLSSPWLRDAAQRERLAALALDASTSVANARVHFAPFAETGEDRSRKAKELRQKGVPVPRLDWKKAGAGMRALLLARRARLTPDEKLSALLDEWANDPFLPHASIAGEIPSPDGWHRLRAERDYRLRAESTEGARVRWFALVPECPSTNVAGLALGFAENAPRWLRRVPRLIGEGAELSAAKLHGVLEATTHAGTALVFATVEREGEEVRTNELALTFRAGSGFRGALSEHFARPYAFGCGLVGGGPDALVATDCANFMTAALRREGWRLPWGNPKQFAEHCEELATWKRGEPEPALDAKDVEGGAFVHFGTHVAAVWEDRPPLGRLDENDRVAHHLEGLPEIAPLGSLLRTRERFRLMRLKPGPDAVRLVFGGDVMLGRKVAEAIDRKAEPLAGIAATLSGADFAMVNLECVASPLGEPAPGHRYYFRAHERTPALLAAAGVDVVSLANNHSRDFGQAAFADAARRLREAHVQAANGSLTPIRLEARGQHFAIFACEDAASEALLAAVREAAKSATVIVLSHWGTEHAAQPDETQRTIAAQLIEAGARILVGSGPHTRQPLVFQNGALVAWSLGNLVFDGPGPDAAWSRGALLEVTLARDGRIIRARELPVRIGEDGTAVLE